MTHSQKWIFSSETDDERNPESYPPYPDPLPDPDGLLTQWLDATRIVPLWAKEWRCRDGWTVGPRVLYDSMWFWFPDGHGTVTVEGGAFPFGPGDLILVPSGLRHHLSLQNAEAKRHLTVHFHAYVFGSVNLLDLVGFPLLIPFSREAPFRTVTEKLVHLYARKVTGWSQLMAAEIFGLLVYLLQHYGSRFRTAERGAGELLRLLPALHCMENRLDDPSLSVADLAKTISVSEVYLRKLFRRLTGLSPVAFLQRRRIQRACLQLRTTQLPVKQIAEVNGFSDTVFFYRVFKQWIKLTPVAYRQAPEV